MEFQEIGEKLGGLTAEQVFKLAEYGKEILNISGIHMLSYQLTNAVTSILTAEDIDTDSLKTELATILQIARITEELNEECWYLGKTPLGLTGCNFDNDRFKLGATTKIEFI